MKMTWKACEFTKFESKGLLDIGEDMDTIIGPEMAFYTDQQTKEKGLISSRIDAEYEIQRQQLP